VRASVPICLVLVLGTTRGAQDLGPSPGIELVRAFDLLDGGDFDGPRPTVREGGVTPVPWWRTSAGVRQLELRDGRPCLRTAAGEFAMQTVPLYAPLARGLVLRGEVAGQGRVTVQDGSDARASLVVGSGQPGFVPFEWTGEQLAQALGHDPLPRLTLHLAGEGQASARWRGLELWVPLPTPSPAELRAEIIEELAWILDLWTTHGGDAHGTPTTFICDQFDVLTGERLGLIRAGHSTFTDLLCDAAAAAPEREDWARAARLATTDVLLRGMHPQTGLPRAWDCVRDVPLDDTFREVGLGLEFLTEVAEHGPEGTREVARELLERAMVTILAHGLAPDGEVMAKYRPRDGLTNSGYSALRRFDVPAQLVRAWRLSGDGALLDAAREGVANLEYSHRWAGTWQSIDPGFDDEFGHYGERATAMWEAAPDEPTFRRLALEGMEYFLPRWRDALRLGGNVAADQVRCWDIAVRIAALEPALRGEVAARVRAAVRVHVKGQQYDGGAWGDVTVFRFKPQVDLQVGDTFGPPQNLLFGLAIAHDALLAEQAGGPDLEELRAVFTAVMRTTREVYRRPHGYLGTRLEATGRNPSGGSIRVAVGLVRMLERL
jgi:hypothetical protein